jgi:hypothetical protein
MYRQNAVFVYVHLAIGEQTVFEDDSSTVE